jgi:hypothetical protein
LVWDNKHAKSSTNEDLSFGGCYPNRIQRFFILGFENPGKFMEIDARLRKRVETVAP